MLNLFRRPPSTLIRADTLKKGMWLLTEGPVDTWPRGEMVVRISTSEEGDEPTLHVQGSRSSRYTWTLSPDTVVRVRTDRGPHWREWV